MAGVHATSDAGDRETGRDRFGGIVEAAGAHSVSLGAVNDAFAPLAFKHVAILGVAVRHAPRAVRCTFAFWLQAVLALARAIQHPQPLVADRSHAPDTLGVVAESTLPLGIAAHEAHDQIVFVADRVLVSEVPSVHFAPKVRAEFPGDLVLAAPGARESLGRLLGFGFECERSHFEVFVGL